MLGWTMGQQGVEAAQESDEFSSRVALHAAWASPSRTCSNASILLFIRKTMEKPKDYLDSFAGYLNARSCDSLAPSAVTLRGAFWVSAQVCRALVSSMVFITKGTTRRGHN